MRRSLYAIWIISHCLCAGCAEPKAIPDRSLAEWYYELESDDLAIKTLAEKQIDSIITSAANGLIEDHSEDSPLSRFYDAKECILQIRNLISSKSVRVREKVADSLALFEAAVSTAAVPHIKALKARHDDDRASSATALHKLCFLARSSISLLKRVATDPNEIVRARSKEGFELFEKFEQDVTPVLREALNDREDVRREAREALSLILSPPVAIAQRIEDTVTAGAQIILDSSASYDPLHQKMKFLWVQVKDTEQVSGAPSEKAQATFRPTTAGHYKFIVYVFAGDGVIERSSSDEVTFDVIDSSEAKDPRESKF